MGSVGTSVPGTVCWYSTSTRSPRKISSFDTMPLRWNASTGISVRRLPSERTHAIAPLIKRPGGHLVEKAHAPDNFAIRAPQVDSLAARPDAVGEFHDHLESGCVEACR
jgi:hypothetical protein